MCVKLAERRIIPRKMPRPSDEIIHNVLNGVASQEEAAAVAKWFATDEGQQYLSKSMNDFFENIQGGFEEIYVLEKIPTDTIWGKIEKSISLHSKKQYKKKSQRILLGVAAVLLPLFLIGSLMLQLTSNSNYIDVYVAKGDQKQILLEDGTSVFLNSDTRFSYPKKFGLFSRKVRLDGEAYFNVEKNKQKPFYIEMSNASIKVLGTAFNVKAYLADKEIKVSLDNGEISLTTSAKKTYGLLPQETLVYNSENNTITFSKNQDTEAYSKWKDSILIFNNTPLIDVIRTLSRSYGVQFIIENRDALSYSYTLTATKENLKGILNDLEKISPVRFSLKNDTVKIQIK